MLLHTWCCIALHISVCLTLKLQSTGDTSILSKKFPSSDIDNSSIHIAPLPPKPLATSIGSQRSAATVETKLSIRCNHFDFGQLSYPSCKDAWNDIPDSIHMQTVGSRTAGRHWDVVLPYRFISRKCGYKVPDTAK